MHHIFTNGDPIDLRDDVAVSIETHGRGMTIRVYGPGNKLLDTIHSEHFTLSREIDLDRMRKGAA